MDMTVFSFVLLNNLVSIPNLLALDFNEFVDQSLHNANAHLVVGTFVVVVNYDQVLVNH